MIRVSDIKVGMNKENRLLDLMAKSLSVKPSDIKEFSIVRKSLDARKKDNIHLCLSVDVTLDSALENKLIKRNKNVTKSEPELVYKVPSVNDFNGTSPVVVGMGPAGLFCALSLAKAGLKPIVIERGMPVDDRTVAVNEYWETGILNTECNVQFGEGGAGTFSDGKLNTTVKDKSGIKNYCLNTLVEFGANPDIKYDYKPHIGTDILSKVVKNIREEIISLGGKVYFNTKLNEIKYDDVKVSSIIVLDQATNEIREIKCSDVILAIGHSARDTFEEISKYLKVEPKPFAIGFRVIHSQKLINESQYCDNYEDVYGEMPSSPYKLTYKSESGRGVYSFCMCPGGYVVNASSEEGELCVNGMSYSGRDGEYANSAIIVQIGPEDFGSKDALAGMYYQRDLEKKAFDISNGKIPVESFVDFKDKKLSDNIGPVNPLMAIKGQWEYADVHTIMPEYINNSFVEGMEYFEGKIKGFAKSNPLIAGIESRTSSPIKILRNEEYVSNINGIYPCGEGAGYAGGITSAAMDGVKVADAIINKYKLEV